jgi:hypothetical protein
MTFKPTMAMNKAWIQSGVTDSSSVSLIARLVNAVRGQVAVGYQDETGFHLGAKPEEKETKWPATR